MYVIGYDPGLRDSGVAVIDPQGQTVVDCAAIKTKASAPPWERIEVVRSRLEPLFERWDLSAGGFERWLTMPGLGGGTGVKVGAQYGMSVAVFCMLCTKYGVALYQCTAQQGHSSTAISGARNPGKDDAHWAVRKMFRWPEPPKRYRNGWPGHVLDAVGIAWWAYGEHVKMTGV
jgi:Holliday junction resolvasome RuvABC endonuclease subunit